MNSFCITNISHQEVTKTSKNDELNIENLRYFIYTQISSNQNIILKQAILETGWLKSVNCKKNNNLFGLTNLKGYYKFKHWKESVIFYRDRIHKKYKKGDYYVFLDNLGYAEDTLYVQKLKMIKIKNF